MPLDFPNTPYVGQIWTATNGVTYIWDGTKWSVLPGSTPPPPGGPFLPIAGGTMQGAIILPDGTPAVSQNNVYAEIGYNLMQGVQPAGGFTQSPYPFGTTTECCAFSTQIVPPDPYGRPILPGVSGYHGPSELATVPDRAVLTFYAGANTAAVNTIVVPSATYTATTVVLSPALTPTQLSFVQQAIAINNQRAVLWQNAPSYIAANIGMQIDTQHTPQHYTGCITAVSSDGTTITVAGWYLVCGPTGSPPGNTAAGQVPPSGIGCYVNPCTKMWTMNGIQWLDATTGPSPTGNNQCQQMTFLEIDSYNNQAAFGTSSNTGVIPTIGISANAHANKNGYGFIGLGNWYSGFMSRGNTDFPFLIQGVASAPGGTDAVYGYVSQVRSDITGGHHPFAYYDFSLPTPGYRWWVQGSGTMFLGASAYDNGFVISTVPPGSPPIISISGPDTNINLRIVPKGTGVVEIDNGGLRTGNPTNSNGILLTTTAAGTAPQVQAIGVDANVNLTLNAQGTGVIDCLDDIQRNANTASIPAVSGGYNPRLNIQGQDGAIPAVQLTSYAQRSAIYFRRADNTGTSPTGLVNNDLIGAIYAAGWDTSVWSGYAAAMAMYVGGNWSATSHPIYLSMMTTPANSIICYERMRIYPSGNVVISQTTGTFPSDDGINSLQVGGQISASNINATNVVYANNGHITNANAAAIPAQSGFNAFVNIQGADNTIPAIMITSYAQRSSLFFRRADNTGASPAGLVNNDLIGAIYAGGWDTTVWTSYAASFTLNAAGTWSATSHPSFLTWGTTPVNSTTQYERMRIFPSGNVAMQTGTGAMPADDGLNILQIVGSIRIGAASTGPTWSSGAGVPASTQPVGSLYSNTSGAAGARLYVSAGGGTWTAIAGV